jgi:hypothetical protein
MNGEMALVSHRKRTTTSWHDREHLHRWPQFFTSSRVSCPREVLSYKGLIHSRYFVVWQPLCSYILHPSLHSRPCKRAMNPTHLCVSWGLYQWTQWSHPFIRHIIMADMPTSVKQTNPYTKSLHILQAFMTNIKGSINCCPHHSR